MKKLFVAMVMALAMVMVSSVAFAAQVVELNEAYNVEQTREAVNSCMPDYLRFNYPMRRVRSHNDYTLTYVTGNQRDWGLVVYQNEQGYDCCLGMIIPDSEGIEDAERAGVVLLAAATGKSYNWSDEEKISPMVETSLNAFKYGKCSFYCKETHRFYELTPSHKDNRWYLVVIAYV